MVWVIECNDRFNAPDVRPMPAAGAAQAAALGVGRDAAKGPLHFPPEQHNWMAPRARLTMAPRTSKKKRSELDKPDHVFDKAAELFRVMSAPMRLKIISCLCEGEQNVSYLLGKIETTQPNMSQHLNTLYKAGVLAKQREGVQIYYRIANEQIVNLCKAVCGQIEDDNKP
jgi:DNA-binding transcriptional ArsR family regulator/predicted small lipoprotein YifL